MKKISAFTLLELLIGMIISSIVIGFCYTGYSIIYKQYLNYLIIKENISNTMQFNSILNTDFTTASSIIFETDKLILDFKSAPQLQYDFRQNYILRKTSDVTDTFMLSALNLVPKYNIENDQQPFLIVNDFSFDAVILGETEHFHFAKNYSAETLVNMQMQYTR